MEKERYKILKDKFVECWIVWELHTNYMVDVFHGNTKKECKEWGKNIYG